MNQKENNINQGGGNANSEFNQNRVTLDKLRSALDEQGNFSQAPQQFQPQFGTPSQASDLTDGTHAMSSQQYAPQFTNPSQNMQTMTPPPANNGLQNTVGVAGGAGAMAAKKRKGSLVITISIILAAIIAAGVCVYFFILKSPQNGDHISNNDYISVEKNHIGNMFAMSSNGLSIGSELSYDYDFSFAPDGNFLKNLGLNLELDKIDITGSTNVKDNNVYSSFAYMSDGDPLGVDIFFDSESSDCFFYLPQLSDKYVKMAVTSAFQPSSSSSYNSMMSYGTPSSIMSIDGLDGLIDIGEIDYEAFQKTIEECIDVYLDMTKNVKAEEKNHKFTAGNITLTVDKYSFEFDNKQISKYIDAIEDTLLENKNISDYLEEDGLDAKDALSEIKDDIRSFDMEVFVLGDEIIARNINLELVDGIFKLDYHNVKDGTAYDDMFKLTVESNYSSDMVVEYSNSGTISSDDKKTGNIVIKIGDGIDNLSFEATYENLKVTKDKYIEGSLNAEISISESTASTITGGMPFEEISIKLNFRR